MITKDLIDYIKKSKVEGRTDQEIKSILLQNGWLSLDIEEAFYQVEIPMHASVPSAPDAYTTFQNSHKKKNHKKLIFVVVFILLLGSGASAYYFRDDLKTLPVIKNIFQSKIIYPSTIGEYILIKTKSERECFLLEDNDDLKASNIKGEVCLTFNEFDYFNSINHYVKGDFLNVDEGLDLLKKALLSQSVVKIINNRSVYNFKSTNEDMLFWFTEIGKFDVLSITEEVRNQDGTVISESANGDNPVAKWFLANYPPI